jgi:hypothetical protein
MQEKQRPARIAATGKTANRGNDLVFMLFRLPNRSRLANRPNLGLFALLQDMRKNPSATAPELCSFGAL